LDGELSTTDRESGKGTVDAMPNLLSIPARKLRLGMYVHLDCSWFLHPFAHQQFKLASEEQLQRIVALDLPVLIDPLRSDAGAELPLEPEPAHDAAGSEPTRSSECSDGAGSVPVPLPAAVQQPEPQSIDRFFEGLRGADQLCAKACLEFQQAFQGLGAGQDSGVAGTKSVINHLVALVSDESMASAVSGLLDCRLLDELDLHHALNVSLLSMMVGQQLEFAPEDLKVLGIGALLHDVGERNIAPEVLARRGDPAPQDQALYVRHPEFGLAILQAIPSFPSEGLRIIEDHHERLDGSGYPHGLDGENLSLFTKVVMVIDLYDDLIRARPPKRSLSPSEALAYLFRHTQRSLSREVVVALIQCLSVYPPGTIVEMVNGAYGLILNVNRHDRFRPLVLLYTPAESETSPVIVNLMTDTSRAIARRAARQHISPRVLKYLDFKRWLSYFLRDFPRSSVVSAAA
jgi:HD-GYP domain-containing protein (c-di-GMP phosphodiesterase class II)